MNVRRERVELDEYIQNQLLQAVKTNNPDTFNHWMKQITPKPQDYGIDFDKVLISAAQYNRPHMIRLLLEKQVEFIGMEAGCKDVALECMDLVRTSLDVNSNTDAGKLLNKVANDLYYCSQLQLMEFYIAVRDGNYHQLENLIKKNRHVKIAAACTMTGETLLHFAAGWGNINVVKVLLKVIEINSFTEDGEVPLHFAVENEDEAMVKLLLQNFALTGCSRKSDGKTPLDLAFDKMNVNIIAALWTENSKAQCLQPGETPLHILVRSGNDEKVGEFLLLRSSININAVNFKHGITALHIAISLGSVDIVKRLLARNHIDINFRAVNPDMTPLDMAASFGHIEIVRLLLARNVHANIVDKQITSAQFAMLKGHVDIANMISEKVFWDAYNAQYASETFKIRKLPENASITEIITHAARDNNRSRKICVGLGWMNAEGKINENRNSQFESFASCKATFWNAYSEQRNREWFTTTKLPLDATLADIIQHAANDNNRSRKVCIKLGWMKPNGELTEDAPETVVNRCFVNQKVMRNI